jgi:hypothetical protein
MKFFELPLVATHHLHLHPYHRFAPPGAKAIYDI